MLQFIFKHPISVTLATLLHIIIVVAMTFQWQDSSQKTAVKSLDNHDPFAISETNVVKIEPLKTFAVDASLVKQQLDIIKAQEAAKRLEQQQLIAKTQQERERLKALKQSQKAAQDKAEKARLLAAEQRRKTELERQKTAEAKRLALLEKKKADAERLKAEQAKKAASKAEQERKTANQKTLLAEKARQAEEAKKRALELEIARKDKQKKALEEAAKQAKVEQEQARQSAELQRQLDEEAAMQRAQQKRQQLLSLKETYISSITAKVKDNWRTPARISPDAQCDLRITQTPKGSVTSVKVLNCNPQATKQFQQAAEKAVYRSEPLPTAPVPELFERVITFEFKP